MPYRKKLEIAVLAMIAEGMSTEEIAKELYRSPRTIERIRQSLLKQSHCRNSAHLVAWGFRNGMLTIDLLEDIQTTQVSVSKDRPQYIKSVWEDKDI